MTDTELASICTELAEMMIKYGAEVYRVEDTITRICAAYGHTEAQIYTTPANFIITLKGETGKPVTDTVSITERETNLDRAGRINELSRQICAAKPSAEAVRKQIGNIKSRSTYKTPVIYASYFVAGATFTFLNGGGAVEAAVGGLLALLIRFIEGRLRSIRASTFLRSALCALAVSLIAAGLFKAGIVPRFDRVIIGATMVLVPGVAMTNCMRDFISGDFYSGMYTMTEALLTAAGLAVGAGSAIAAAIRL
ncbi:MAG: threonine/serine exporter family protein [Huintestinicola sp.]